ncbi:transposase family protein, partial [Escherichia coli]|nr:transposase family protein [Escherichia coli]
HSLSAAYRNLDAEAAADVTKRYDAFCAHYGMLASRNNPGEAHENGSVEAHNNHLKVALDQALILRGSRDFADLASWRRFVDELVARRNRRRESAVRIEMAALRPLPARRTTDFTEVVARVTKTGGFLVHQVFYSAPSQLIGKRSNRRFASGETGPCLRRPDRGLSRSDPCRHAPPPSRPR